MRYIAIFNDDGTAANLFRLRGATAETLRRNGTWQGSALASDVFAGVDTQGDEIDPAKAAEIATAWGYPEAVPLAA